jgi:hypothetical protein
MGFLLGIRYILDCRRYYLQLEFPRIHPQDALWVNGMDNIIYYYSGSFTLLVIET